MTYKKLQERGENAENTSVIGNRESVEGMRINSLEPDKMCYYECDGLSRGESLENTGFLAHRGGAERLHINSQNDDKMCYYKCNSFFYANFEEAFFEIEYNKSKYAPFTKS